MLMRLKYWAFCVAAACIAVCLPPLQAAKASNNSSAEDLFTNRSIPHLRIEISPEGMDILRAYQFDVDEPMERTNVLATIREGSAVYTNVAIHLKGHLGSFRPVDSKPALTLNFDKHADGQRFHGLQKIHLNNSVQDYSYVSEQISRELFLTAALPSPRASHATVELNDRKLGLYVLLEGWNKQFLKRHFRNPTGNLYDGGTGKEITSVLDVNIGDNPDHHTTLDLLAGAVQEPKSTRLAAVQQVLDLDRFITLVAMEVLSVHWDGYALNKNNYRIYHNLESDKLVFLPHGMDQMFGVYRMSPTSSITPMMRGLVAKGVIETPEGRRRYLERIGQLLTNVLDVQKLSARIDQLSAKIRPALADDPAALQNQQRSAMLLRNRIVNRAASVREQLPNANTPITFDASGSYALSGWTNRRDSGSPSFRRERTGSRELLHVIASGNLAYGSWRTMVRLGEGDYQLVGKVKILDAEFGPRVKSPGASIRNSGERLATMVTNATDWTTITYDFRSEDVTDWEVVLEFRATKGDAVFDASSLRVIRKEGPKTAERTPR
jgi:spore coat protein H